MVRRLLQGGTRSWSRPQSEAIQAHVQLGAKARATSGRLRQLNRRRVAWVMVPSGQAVESTIEQFVPISPRDIVIDGGNSNFPRDRCGSAQALEAKGIGSSTPGRAGAFGASRSATA